MSKIIVNPQSYREVNSKTTTVQIGVGSQSTGCVYPVPDGMRICLSSPATTATVICPFYVELTSTEEGYMATSNISNAFELGETAGQAFTNYLEFLVDELIWLQNKEEELSSALRGDLHLLQRHMRIE